MSGADRIASVRQAAAVCQVTPPVVRRWLSLGLIPEPPWTRQQLHQIRDETDPQGRRRGPQVPHGTLTRWLEGCDCDGCREAQKDAARARFRAQCASAAPRRGAEQLLDAIYGGQPFRTVLRDLGVTSNQVWGLTKTDQEWSEKLEAALTATRRDDLHHGTNAAYVQGCVCSECRSISASVWLGTGANPASNVRAVLVGCLTASPVLSPRRADQGEAA